MSIAMLRFDMERLLLLPCELYNRWFTLRVPHLRNNNKKSSYYSQQFICRYHTYTPPILCSKIILCLKISDFSRKISGNMHYSPWKAIHFMFLCQICRHKNLNWSYMIRIWGDQTVNKRKKGKLLLSIFFVFESSHFLLPLLLFFLSFWNSTPHKRRTKAKWWHNCFDIK